ncbi:MULTISPECIES: hypothetical protein [Morganellaceae]|nr:hypothetical protein [Proteus mirabilis]RBL15733.1 hypothetical protein CCZ10_25190 [Escherichia coli]WOS22911.1 hypothetical protein R5Q96_19840 [Proteus mirabilis]WOS26739.1 hypothetical protein R5Q03_19895 [Proteus mirabilis]
MIKIKRINFIPSDELDSFLTQVCSVSGRSRNAQAVYMLEKYIHYLSEIEGESNKLNLIADDIFEK